MNYVFSFTKFLIKLYIVLYIAVHIAFFTSSKTVHYLTFQNFINLPLGNLSNPREFGQENVHNFYMNTELPIKIGIWHYIPKDLSYSYEKDSYNGIEEHFQRYFKVYDTRPIIIYAHGSDRNRAAAGRIGLANKLRDLGYHVFALDYRGYGDSTGSPTEMGVVNDLLLLNNFIKSYQPRAKIYLWGHSLGAAVVAHAAKILSEFHAPPLGIILESPFLNLKDAATEYFIAKLFYNNPWIIKLGNKALEDMDIRFTTDKHITEIKSKILLFHAEDDWFIPHDRSFDLLRIAEKERPNDYPKVELKILDSEHGLGHSSIYKHDEIYTVVK